MKHKIMGLWMTVMLLVLLSPDLADTAYAGEINSAEQKVVSAVSAAFSYQGKTYAIKSQYIAEGKSKLAEDGIDLSDGEADSYIAQFRNSYAELVESGYCEEVGGQSGEQTSGKKENSATKKPGHPQDGSDSGTQADQGKQDSGTDRNAAKAKDQTESSDGQNSASEHTQAEKARNELFIKTVLGEPQEEQQSGSETAGQTPLEDSDNAEWLEEEDLGTTVDFDADDISAAREQKLTISESGNHYRIQAGDDKKKNTENSGKILNGILYLRQWKILSYVIFAVTVCTAAGIGCYIWKVQKRQHKKRKLRLGLAVAAGISMAGCAFLLMLVMGLYFGIYNKEAIHRQLMESDYYSGITQMTRQLAGEKLQEMGCEEKIAAEVLPLSYVYIEEKQYIDAVLSGKKFEISTDVIESALMEKIPDSLGENKSVLIQEITAMYQNILQFELGKIIRENRQFFLPWCYLVAGISSFLLLLLFVLVYMMYGYLHKSVRVGVAGIFASSLLVAGGSLTMRLRHFARGFHAEPVYYQQFIQKYVNWSVNVMFYVGCIGLLAAVALTVWKRYLHMIYVE